MIDSNTNTSARRITAKVRGMDTSDGAGVRLKRVIGQPRLPDLDPFLLLDEFRSDDAADYIAGFPEHPHRGFETVTYMLAGRMRHRDNKGNSGLLTAGSVQWMTAGRGIQHSEMPEQEDGLMHGFQLWVNLPARDKMIEPRYQDIAPERIPEADIESGRVRILAGRFNGIDGPVQAPDTDPIYLDVSLDGGAALRTELPAAHNAFIYAYGGPVAIGGDTIESGELAVLSHGTTVEAHATSATRFILVAGRPLGEPVERYGPIVMNTKAEVQQAFQDLRSGNF